MWKSHALKTMLIFLTQKQFLSRIFEDYIYNHKLNFHTKFTSLTTFSEKKITKITLNFGFKKIKFNKKRMGFFFFILEAITNQKCVITISKKDMLSLRIKKGAVTGCKITITGENLYEFLDNLLIMLPRSDIFKGFSLNNNSQHNHTFSTKIYELYNFQPIALMTPIYITNLDINFKFNTNSNIEKQFLFNHNKLPLTLK